MTPRIRSPRALVGPALAALAVAFAALPAASASASSNAAPAASPTASAPAQRTKMKACNAEAKGKHGDERRSFMKQCLSKHPASEAG